MLSNSRIFKRIHLDHLGWLHTPLHVLFSVHGGMGRYSHLFQSQRERKYVPCVCDAARCAAIVYYYDFRDFIQPWRERASAHFRALAFTKHSHREQHSIQLSEWFNYTNCVCPATACIMRKYCLCACVFVGVLNKHTDKLHLRRI